MAENARGVLEPGRERRVRRGFRWEAVAVVAGAICVATMTWPATAPAATTIGSNLGDDATTNLGCGGCTVSDAHLAAGNAATGGLFAPSDGVVVRWRIKVGDMANPVTFRITRPGNSSTRTGAGTGPTVTPLAHATSVFETRMPIGAGDALGIDCCGPGGEEHSLTAFAQPAGAFIYVWRPPLTDGEAPRPNNPTLNIETLINADVEVDVDGDGFGDETQDGCPALSGSEGGCPLPPPQSLAQFQLPAQTQVLKDTTAPMAVIGGWSRQNVVKQRAVIVTGQSSEAGTLSASGTINLPGASKAIALVPKAASVRVNVRTKLKLKLTRKTLAAVKKALRKGRKPKAKIALAARDTAGNTSAIIKKTIKVKSHKKRIGR